MSVDRQLILSVFDHHQQLMGRAAAMLRRDWGSRQAEQVVRTALKPLYRRRAQRAPVRDLEVDKATPCILLRRCACTRGCTMHVIAPIIWCDDCGWCDPRDCKDVDHALDVAKQTWKILNIFANCDIVCLHVE